MTGNARVWDWEVTGNVKVWDWECQGLDWEVTGDAEISSPRSRRVQGASVKFLSHSHVLELRVQFSSCVTSVNIDPATSSVSLERIRESATGINPFPAKPATELSN